MTFSRRESVLTLATLAIILFGGTAILARSKFQEAKDIRARRIRIALEIAQDRELIASEAKIRRDLDELRTLLPQQPADRTTDTYWLSVMDRIASDNGLKILKRQVGKEEQVGDIYELPMEAREWEGTLDALVHFLFELQGEGVMLDVASLWIKPKSPLLLKGSFTLKSAYTKASAGDEASAEVQ